MKEFQRVKIALGPYGVDGGVLSASNRLPVELPPGGGGLTDTELRATPVVVDAGIEQPLTDAALRASAVPVSLASVPAHAVTGPLTDAQLRATAVPVSLASVPAHAVTGPITNAELRATPVPVSIGASSAFTFVSANNAAPAANAVQADTGALAAGDYELNINLMVSDTVAVGKGLIIEHRNAANSATINILGGASPNGGAIHIIIAKLTLAASERIRVIAGSAAGAASSRYISSIGRRAA